MDDNSGSSSYQEPQVPGGGNSANMPNINRPPDSNVTSIHVSQQQQASGLNGLNTTPYASNVPQKPMVAPQRQLQDAQQSSIVDSLYGSNSQQQQQQQQQQSTGTTSKSRRAK